MKNAFSAVLQSDGCSHNDLHAKSASKKVIGSFLIYSTILYNQIVLGSTIAYYVPPLLIQCRHYLLILLQQIPVNQHVSALFTYSTQGRKGGKKTQLFSQQSSLSVPCGSPTDHQPDSLGKPRWLRKDIVPSRVCSTSSEVLRDVQDRREAAVTLQHSNKCIFSKIHLWSPLIIIS